MVQQQTLGNTDSCIVTGERHSGKLTLVLTLLKSAECLRPVLITPFEKETNSRKMDQTRILASSFSGCEAFEILYVKPDWRLRKRDLGFNYLIDDLQQAVENVPGDAIILHRMEEFFEVQDRIHIELFISAVTSAAKQVGKKLFITLQHDEAHQLYLEQVERYVDLELLVERPANGIDTRDVTVLYSSLPVQQSNFSLVRKAIGHFALQTAADMSVEESVDSGKVLLISEDTALVNNLTYLLRDSDFSLKVIAPSVAEIVHQLISRPELIIFAADESETAELMRIARDNHLKVLRISTEGYVRKLDRLQASQKGYLDLLERDFYLEDFVLVVERALRTRIYDTSFSDLPEETPYLDCKRGFFERVQTFVDNGLCFSIFSFRTPGIKCLEDAQVLAGRPYDMVCYDEHSHTLKFFAANLLAHNAALVERKVLASDPGAELLAIQEAHEFRAGVPVEC